MGHVLKASQVRLEEPVQLGIDRADTPESPGAHRPEMRSHVRMTQNDSSGAVLEVTCSCGRVIHVHCEYAAPAPAEPES